MVEHTKTKQAKAHVNHVPQVHIQQPQMLQTHHVGLLIMAVTAQAQARQHLVRTSVAH